MKPLMKHIFDQQEVNDRGNATTSKVSRERAPLPQTAPRCFLFVPTTELPHLSATPVGGFAGGEEGEEKLEVDRQLRDKHRMSVLCWGFRKACPVRLFTLDQLRPSESTPAPQVLSDQWCSAAP